MDVARSMGKKPVGPVSNCYFSSPVSGKPGSVVGDRLKDMSGCTSTPGPQNKGATFGVSTGFDTQFCHFITPSPDLKNVSSIVCVIYFMDEQHSRLCSAGFCVIIHVFADSLGALV